MPVASESSSSEVSSSDSSDEGSGADVDMTTEKEIEVPDSVVKRFFSNPQVLTDFCHPQKGTNAKAQFVNLMKDVCASYRVSDESHNEMTELAYIVFERLNSSRSPDLA
jgi:hypothetical protein